jgi:Holliday junction resolvase RusA-like endonuclease
MDLIGAGFCVGPPDYAGIVPYLDHGARDYLDAIASWSRRVLLQIETVELLRKPRGRSQARRQEHLLEDARSQLRTEMRARRRRAFRGEVSVELTIFAPSDVVAPSAPKSVKRYLDGLNGIAYADDRQIAHLVVRRFADDHPYRQHSPSAPRSPSPARTHPSVHVSVMPLRLYVADYDRAFAGRARRHDEELDEEQDYEDRRELSRLYEEREQDAEGDGIYGLGNTDLVGTLRDLRETEIRRLEINRLLRQEPDRSDRPGPAPNRHLTLRESGNDVALLLRRYGIPETIWLPPLLTERRDGEGEPWARLARNQLIAHREKWGPILPDFFDQPIALDIAIFGTGTSTHDIDNVAHVILQNFEELYCQDRRGTVITYRVYRRTGEQSGIRVQLMTDERLRQLEQMIEEARSDVIRAGPSGDW